MADFTNSRNRYPARRALFDALQAACLRQTSLLRIPGGGWTTLCDVAAEGWENEGHVKFQVRPLRAPGRDIFSHGGAALPDCNFAALSNSGSPARDSSTGSGGRGSRGENREAGTYRICPARLFTERSSAVSGTMCSRLGDVITWNGGEWRLLLCRPASLEEGRPSRYIGGGNHAWRGTGEDGHMGRGRGLGVGGGGSRRRSSRGRGRGSVSDDPAAQYRELMGTDCADGFWTSRHGSM